MTVRWRAAFVAAIAAALWCAAAWPQSNVVGSGVWGDIKHSGGGSYSGPGNTVSSASMFFSCARAYSAAYATATGNLCIIADVGTGAITCTMKAATNGFADLTSSLCASGTLTVPAFCTAHTSCVVTHIYDQSGALACSGGTTCDLVQATLASMPALVFSAINGLPCMTFTTSTTINATNSFTQAQPFSMGIVSKRTGNTGSFTDIFGNGGTGALYPNGTNNVGVYAGSTVSATASDNAYHGLQMVFNNASSAVNVDNSATTGTAGTNGFSGDTMQFGTDQLVGSICEGGLWPIAFSSGQQTSMFTNQNSSSGYNGGL